MAIFIDSLSDSSDSTNSSSNMGTIGVATSMETVGEVEGV
jgi:hypothetical protein